MRTNALWIILLCGVLALHAGARSALAPATSDVERSTQEAYLLPPPEILRASALNYNSFAADMVWVRALIYFGEVRSERRGMEFEYLEAYASSVVSLDHDFYPIYMWLTATYMATRKQLTHEDIMKMDDFLEIGIARFPSRHELLSRAGLNALGYSLEHSPAERVEQLTRSIGYLEQCMRLAGCQDNTAFVVSWMYNKRAQLQAEIAGARVDREADVARERAFALEVYPRLADPELRARMRKQLLAMGVSEAQLDALEREQVGQVRLDYEARAPYLPLDLWALTVSPRP